METPHQLDRLSFSGTEPYMNEKQLAYFKNKLILQKMERLEEIERKKNTIKMMGSSQPDLIDKSNSITQINQAIESCERSREVVRQIDEALARIENGSFGYCTITGMEIGLKRLEAIPFAAMSIKAIEETEVNSNFYTGH